MSEYNGKERRKFKRVKVNLVVVYKEDEPLDVKIRAGNRERQATMVDISEEGISVIADVALPVDTILSICFSLADDKTKGVDFYGFLEVRGKVLYVIPSATGQHRLGIQFIDMSEADKRAISNFVDIIDKHYSVGG